MKELVRRLCRAAAVLFALTLLGACTYSPMYHELLRGGPDLVTEEFMVPAADPGIQLYVRNKRLQSLATFTPDNIVLFVHGATYPAETAFDLRLEGTSWMDYIARRGYDVYLVDVRGYGKSTRPPEMDQPAANNRPIVTTEVAVRDYGAAVDFILKRRGLNKLMVLGWSWGTAIMASYTSGNNHKVNRLVMYAPLWPAGKRLYNPADIRVPTLLIVAERDADTPATMAQTLFPLLVNAEPKRLVIIGEGTHSVLMEKNRMQLFREVQLFMDEARR